ncbi:MAG: hypothetical protein DRM97_06580, partial [Thermoprotei archaeon]
MIRRAVFKIGGSLMRHTDELKALLKMLEALCKEGRELVIVPGGGPFADVVRDLQDELRYDDETAHWMAIKSMEVYGVYLSGLLSDTTLCETLEEIERAWKEGILPILLPFKLLRKHDVLPKSWRVTSDSIA